MYKKHELKMLPTAVIANWHTPIRSSITNPLESLKQTRRLSPVCAITEMEKQTAAPDINTVTVFRNLRDTPNQQDICVQLQWNNNEHMQH